MPFPVFDLDLAPPGQMSLPTFSGGAIESGRTQDGGGNAADMTGGGLLTMSYKNIMLRNGDPTAFRYWSQLGTILNSRVRKILVPIMLTDFIQSQEWIATFHADASKGDATVTLDVTNMFLLDDPFVGGEWFEINYGDNALSSRAHCISDVDSSAQIGDRSYRCTLGIRAPLRGDVAAGTVVNLVRPKCLMRLAPGSTISADIQGYYKASPEVSFIEAYWNA